RARPAHRGGPARGGLHLGGYLRAPRIRRVLTPPQQAPDPSAWSHGSAVCTGDVLWDRGPPAMRNVHRLRARTRSQRAKGGGRSVGRVAHGFTAGFVVERLLQSLATLGVDVARMCRSLGIDRHGIRQIGAVVPRPTVIALLRAALEETHDE